MQHLQTKLAHDCIKFQAYLKYKHTE